MHDLGHDFTEGPRRGICIYPVRKDFNTGTRHVPCGKMKVLHGTRRLAIGEVVDVRVRGVVVAVHDAHGLSYEVVLPQRDFVNVRRVSLDPDEVRIPL